MINKQVVTSALLWAHMGKVKLKQEVLFLLQFWGAVHLLS